MENIVNEDNEDAIILMAAVKKAEQAYYDFISAQGNDGAYFPIYIRAIIVGDDLCSPMGEEAIIDKIPTRDDLLEAERKKRSWRHCE